MISLLNILIAALVPKIFNPQSELGNTGKIHESFTTSWLLHVESYSLQIWNTQSL